MAIPGKQGQNPQAQGNPLAAAVAAGGGPFLQGLANSGLDQSQIQLITQGLTNSNPLIAANTAQELPALEQYGQSYNAAEAGLASLGQSQNYQDALLYGSNQLQGAQIQNQLQGNTLEQQNIQQQLGITNQQYGLQQQLAGIQQGQLQYNEGIQQSQAQVQGAATGTLNTQGYAQKQGQIGEQYQVSSAELANQLAGEGLTNKGQNLAAANQTAQLQNAAASLGISTQQLQNQLSSGLAQIGVQTGQTGDQLLQQAAQAQQGQAQGLGAMFSNIGALTGLGPQAFTSSLPNLYGG